MITITKKKIIVASIIIAVIWSILITQNVSWVSQLSGIHQFILTTALIYSLPAIILGIAFNNSQGSRINLKKTVGSFTFLAAFDLITPPLLVNFQGVVSTTALLYKGTIDYFLYSIYSNYATGLNLFLLVYPISFILLTVVSVYLLTEKNIFSMLFNEK